MYKLNLAEDPTGRSKAISFNFTIITEFKAGHINYLIPQPQAAIY